jgi:hypothetical protein
MGFFFASQDEHDLPITKFTSQVSPSPISTGVESTAASLATLHARLIYVAVVCFACVVALFANRRSRHWLLSVFSTDAHSKDKRDDDPEK